MKSDTPSEKKVLVLRTCDAERKAYGGFQWPESGHVEAPDWEPTKECGNGLHGLLWGRGGYDHLSKDNLAKWMIVEVAEKNIVDLGDKVKFPHGTVIYCGDSKGALKILQGSDWGKDKTDPSTTGYAAHSSTTGDDAHSSTTGRYAHSSTTGYAAHSSTTGYAAHSSTTGYAAHSSTTGYAAHSSTTGYAAHSSTTGDDAHSSTTGYAAHSSTTGYAAHSSTTGRYAHSSTTGRYAHSSTTGRYAHSSTTGRYAHSSTTGRYAHSSTTGRYAHSSTTGYAAHSSTTGDDAVAGAFGYSARVKAKNGPLVIAYHDGNRRRLAVGYPGENGIKSDTWYQVNEKGEFVEIEEES